MTKKSLTVLIIVLAVVLVVSLAGAVITRSLYYKNHVFVGEDIYDKDVRSLDLRGAGISIDYFEELQKELPLCDIAWEVPFQGGFVDADTRELTITSLTQADMETMDYFQSLTAVNAEGCRDYDQLMALQQRRPDIAVRYRVSIGGSDYPQDTRELTVTGLTGEDVQLLQYLPQLERLHLLEPAVPAEALQALGDGVTVTCEKQVLGRTVTDDDTELDFTGISITDIGELERDLAYFPNLEKVIVSDCGLDNETLAAARDRVREQYKLVWTVQCGKLTALEDLNLGNTYGSMEPIVQMTWLKNLWWIGRSASFYAKLSEELPDTHKEFYAKHTVGNGWRKLQNYYDMRDLLGMEYM